MKTKKYSCVTALGQVVKTQRRYTFQIDLLVRNLTPRIKMTNETSSWRGDGDKVVSPKINDSSPQKKINWFDKGWSANIKAKKLRVYNWKIKRELDNLRERDRCLFITRKLTLSLPDKSIILASKKDIQLSSINLAVVLTSSLLALLKLAITQGGAKLPGGRWSLFNLRLEGRSLLQQRFYT